MFWKNKKTFGHHLHFNVFAKKNEILNNKKRIIIFLHNNSIKFKKPFKNFKLTKKFNKTPKIKII